jgi:hypothetical protein
MMQMYVGADIFGQEQRAELRVYALIDLGERVADWRGFLEAEGVDAVAELYDS